jgi:hypothetical protein
MLAGTGPMHVMSSTSTDRVADWMVEPRQNVHYNGAYPAIGQEL